MRKKDKKYYEILLKELISGFLTSPEEIDTTLTGNSITQNLIKKFFIEFFEYSERVAVYYKENYFDKNPGSEKDPLNVPDEIRYNAAMQCRLTGLRFKMTRHFPLRKRYKFLKLKGEFEEVGYGKREKDANKI